MLPLPPSAAAIAPCFNEAAGADPADAARTRRCDRALRRFNEAAGADPADATYDMVANDWYRVASMRPRGQTPRMLLDDLNRLKRDIELQ